MNNKAFSDMEKIKGKLLKKHEKEIARIYTEAFISAYRELLVQMEKAKKVDANWNKRASLLAKEAYVKQLAEKVIAISEKYNLKLSAAFKDTQVAFMTKTHPRFEGNEEFQKLIEEKVDITNEELLNILKSGKLYESKDGVPRELSDRIWDAAKCAGNKIQDAIASMIAQGKGPADMAETLKEFGTKGHKTWNHSKIKEKLGPGYARKHSGGLDYEALRLARTTTTHLHQLQVIHSNESNPYVNGVKYHSVHAANRTCQQCIDRDGKLFTLDEVPLDHPNGMCWLEPVMMIDGREVTLEEMAKDIGKWIKGESNSGLMDKAYPELKDSPTLKDIKEREAEEERKKKEEEELKRKQEEEKKKKQAKPKKKKKTQADILAEVFAQVEKTIDIVEPEKKPVKAKIKKEEVKAVITDKKPVKTNKDQKGTILDNVHAFAERALERWSKRGDFTSSYTNEDLKLKKAFSKELSEYLEKERERLNNEYHPINYQRVKEILEENGFANEFRKSKDKAFRKAYLDYVGTGNSFEMNRVLYEGEYAAGKAKPAKKKQIDATTDLISRYKLAENTKLVRYSGFSPLNQILEKLGAEHLQMKNLNVDSDAVLHYQKVTEQYVALVNDATAGKEFTFDSFTSVSYNANANLFSHKFVEMEIYAKEGLEALYTVNHGESEIVLQRGTTFKMIGVTYEDRKIKLIVEAVRTEERDDKK